MDFLINRLKDFCCQQGLDKVFWVGYSGGLDSHVLLHALARLRSFFPIQIHAVHVNHGLSQNASGWAKHCAAVCEQLQINYSEYIISLNAAANKNLEESARESRYQVFAKLMNDEDCLLTAHHQDDQAETILLQMLRGAGPKGLAAMPRIKSFAKGSHGRPFLDVTREELKIYAEQNQLTWVNDESNENVIFARNFIRHQILPSLKIRWPSTTKTLARVSENCAEAQTLLDEIAEQDLQNVRGSQVHSLSVHKLRQLNLPRQRNVLRFWLSGLGFSIPSSVKIQQVQDNMLHARQDKSPHVYWSDIELRRYRDELFVMKCLIPHDSSQTYEWNLAEKLDLPGIGVLKACLHKGKGLSSNIEKVTVRFRQQGEDFKMHGHGCTHTLKKLFQSWGIPPWERSRIPLVYVGDKLAAVVGHAVSDEFSVGENELGYDFSL